MSDKERLMQLFNTLEKVKEKKLGEDWQYKMELTILEEKIINEIKRLQLEMV